MHERETIRGGANLDDDATAGGAEVGGGAAVQARSEDLLTPGEVARLFGVDPKTVTRWAAAGKLEALRTLGGHRRYRAEEVNRLLDQRSGRSVNGGAGSPPGEG